MVDVLRLLRIPIDRSKLDRNDPSKYSCISILIKGSRCHGIHANIVEWRHGVSSIQRVSFW